MDLRSRPAKTPGEIIARLNRELVAILRAGDVRDKLASQGAEVIGSTPAQFAQVMKNDIGKWARVTAKLRLKTE